MWRKSSFSDVNGNCVEIRGDLSALRDSKHPDVHLPVARAALAHLVEGLTRTNG
jgi:hypothetical protein